MTTGELFLDALVILAVLCVVAAALDWVMEKISRGWGP